MRLLNYHHDKFTHRKTDRPNIICLMMENFGRIKSQLHQPTICMCNYKADFGIITKCLASFGCQFMFSWKNCSLGGKHRHSIIHQFSSSVCSKAQLQTSEYRLLFTFLNTYLIIVLMHTNEIVSLSLLFVRLNRIYAQRMTNRLRKACALTKYAISILLESNTPMCLFFIFFFTY